MSHSAATSSLYECTVLHERFAPKRHRFAYRLFYFAFDLDELPALDRRLALFSLRRANLFRFQESSYLPLGEPIHNPTPRVFHGECSLSYHNAAASPSSSHELRRWGGLYARQSAAAEMAGVKPAPPSRTDMANTNRGVAPCALSGPIYASAGTDLSTLKARARAFCSAHGADFGPQGRVLLITLPRVLGFQFNPVSFYFCSDVAGVPVGVIAEVTNTFREVKPYFIPPSADAARSGVFRLRTPKHFYVSPFSGPNLEFDFTLRTPGEWLAVRIDDHEAGHRVLHTTLIGRRRSLTDARLAWFLFKYPLVTLGIVARIHWQAFRLWLKRVPFFPKGGDAASQRNLYRPHSSIVPISVP